MVVFQAMEDIQLLAERSGNPVGTGISERKSLLENFNFEKPPNRFGFFSLFVDSNRCNRSKEGWSRPPRLQPSRQFSRPHRLTMGSLVHVGPGVKENSKCFP